FTTISETIVGTTSTKLYMPSKMIACEPVATPLATPTRPSKTVRAIENLSVACSMLDCLDFTGVERSQPQAAQSIASAGKPGGSPMDKGYLFLSYARVDAPLV